MIYLQRILFVMLIIITTQVFSEDLYRPDTGDSDLDASLHQINKKINKSRKTKFITTVSNEFQVQKEKVTELFNHYEFTAADVLMTLSVSDITGQPVNIVSRAYYEHKVHGWKYVLQQLSIKQNSREFIQVKNDAKINFVK